MKNTITLGIKVRDKITNYTGIVTGRCEYISGCDQALVTPAVKEDGTGHDGRWFDIQRLDIVDGLPIILDNSETPGGDIPAPVR